MSRSQSSAFTVQAAPMDGLPAAVAQFAAEKLQQPLPSAARALICLGVLVAVWADRRRSRRHLAELSDHQLRDIGVNRREALNEALKPFWKK